MRQQNPWSWAISLGALLLGTACRGEPAPTLAPSAPPAPAEAERAPVAQASAPSVAVAASSAAAAPSGSAAPGAVVAAPSASVAASPASDDSPLLAPDGSPLPQTEERPSTTSERFRRRMQQLAGSILTGDVERGRASFFPLVAYAQVKDVQKPERDYRYRLMAHFERDVREYHKALGKQPEQAEFLGVDVPEERVQWMKPGKEGNRLGYYRVLRARLRFRLASGADKTFELTSMISWRGEWYVVHLHGFE